MSTLTDRAEQAARRAETLHAAARVARGARRALEDTGVTDAALSRASGVCETRVGAWWRGTAHVPLWLLTLPVVPVGAVMRIVGDALSARASGEPAQSTETATALLVGACGAALSAAGAALADGRVDADERRALRPVVAALHDRCARWLRQHGGDVTQRGGDA